MYIMVNFFVIHVKRVIILFKNMNLMYNIRIILTKKKYDFVIFRQYFDNHLKKNMIIFNEIRHSRRVYEHEKKMTKLIKKRIEKK